MHPDESEPGWITLDLDRLWKAEVDFAVDLKEGRAHPDDWPGFSGRLAEADDTGLDGP